MTDQWTCDDVRERAFEYRRGELEADQRESVEAHLEDCAACRDYVEKLFSMVSAAATIEEPEAGQADALFAGIEAKIAEKPAEEESPVAESAEDSSRRWLAVAGGLAAGFVIAATLFFVVGPQFGSGEGGQERAEAEQSPAQKPQEDRAEDRASSADASFADLERQSSKRDGLDIYATSDSRWQVTGDADYTLHVERGTILVEFVSSDGAALTVDAPEMQIDVVGTIFFVRAAEAHTSTGVVTGAVDVRRFEDEEPIRVESGQQVRRVGGISEIPAEHLQELESKVDVRRHHAALRKVADTGDTARERVDTKLDTPSRSVNRERPASKSAKIEAPEVALSERLVKRRAKAEQATRLGEYQKAERIYRELLDELSTSHPAASSIHLDLAGLYVEHMDRPRRALPYLRLFLERWPNDVAAPAVRRRLCRTTRELGVPEPHCPSSDGK